MFTMVAIERRSVSDKCMFVAIKNATYVRLAEELAIRHNYYSNANNTGNVMEALHWLAFEQKRYKFILTIAHMAADIEFRTSVKPAPAAAIDPVCAITLNSTIRPLRRPAVASDSAGTVASGPVKRQRKQALVPRTNQASSHSSNSTSWRPQASSPEDVHEASASTSTHPFEPDSEQSLGHLDPVPSTTIWISEYPESR